MATENDISLDQVQARHWIENVNQEISSVETLLSQVAQELSEVVPDDPIIEAIEKIGIKMDDAWKSMISEFKKSTSLIGDAFDVIRKGFENAVEIVEGIFSKL